MGWKPRPRYCCSTNPGSEYTDEERELLKAVDEYRREQGIKFMTATDYLKVLKSMGYSRGAP